MLPPPLTAGSNQAIALCQSLARAYAMAACNRTALQGSQPLRSIDPRILSRRFTSSVSSVLHTSTMLRQVNKVGSTFLTWGGKKIVAGRCGVLEWWAGGYSRRDRCRKTATGKIGANTTFAIQYNTVIQGNPRLFGLW